MARGHKRKHRSIVEQSRFEVRFRMCFLLSVNVFDFDRKSRFLVKNCAYSQLEMSRIPKCGQKGWKIMVVRSHVNSRCFFSRQIVWFFDHSSLPHHQNPTKIGGNLPTDLPDLSKPKNSRSNRGKTKILETKFRKKIEKF